MELCGQRAQLARGKNQCGLRPITQPRAMMRGAPKQHGDAMAIRGQWRALAIGGVMEWGVIGTFSFLYNRTWRPQLRPPHERRGNIKAIALPARRLLRAHQCADHQDAERGNDIAVGQVGNPVEQA